MRKAKEYINSNSYQSQVQISLPSLKITPSIFRPPTIRVEKKTSPDSRNFCMKARTTTLLHAGKLHQ